MKFQRAISPLGLLFAGVGSVIGSGWLFGPLYAAQYAGPAAALSWIIGGVLMIIVALTFAELGTSFPVTGGMIQFARLSYGPLMSFVIGWMVWISSVAVAPVETLAIIQYVANYLPNLVTLTQNVPVLTTLGMAVAAGVMFLMCLLNYYGARFFSRSNSLITGFKLIVPLLTIVLLVFTSFHAYNFQLEQQGGFLPYGWHGVLASLPLGGVIYSFIGSNTILQLAGETKKPQYSIPLALIGTMIFCILLYTLLQIAFVGAISAPALAKGWHQLHFSGDMGPFAGLMSAIGLGWFVYFIYMDALISPFGTGYVFTASTARIGFGLSEIGAFPASLKKLNHKGVPVRSMIINYAVGLLLFLPFPGWQKLATFIISCFIVSYIVGPLAIISLRNKYPDINRPFHLPFAKIIAPVAFYICNLLIYWTGWETVSKIILILGIGILYYMISLYKTHIAETRLAQRQPLKPLSALSGSATVQKPVFFNEVKQLSWLIVYFALLALISHAGSFGGGSNEIPFGLDFVLIALMSVFVYFFALQKMQVADSSLVSAETLAAQLQHEPSSTVPVLSRKTAS